ncbi:Trypanosomal VSG domain containing protein, putative [Trypanosoma equiperdum]|uniref:Trypanosomal VSG domain containing protein, putative n=1 Tax=Trypanosoma equiperdum TaxID=5694 RepID=A0A1G4HZM5_TRYEQ|nr:Trypanosomal VSG domain containing protein, putative [Trypanosoma equiperdum]
MTAGTLRFGIQQQPLEAISNLEAGKAALPKEKTTITINTDLKGVLYGEGNTGAKGTGQSTFGSGGNAACGNDGSADKKVGTSLANGLACRCGDNSDGTAAAGCKSNGSSTGSKFASEACGPTTKATIVAKY